MTVWLIVLFFKSSFIELSKAEGAYEVLGVELPEHGGDTTARDGLVATGAEGATFAMVMGLTVGMAFVLEERAAVERLAAFL